MPGIMRMTIKEANELAEYMEQNHVNSDSLRAAINDVNDAKNGHSSIPANKVDDEGYIQQLRSKSNIEHGQDLECMICHDKFDHLISGTCEVCFREWMLSTKR